MRQRLEYALVWPVVKTLGLLPRPLSRALAILLAGAVFHLHPRLRRVGVRNLQLAYPGMKPRQRRKILRRVYVSLGRQLAEFCMFPRYTRANVSQVAVYEGFENYDAAQRRGKGVLFLTAHLGGWEIGSFAHSVYGHPLHVVVRALDNKYLDRMVERHRTLHGNSTFEKQDFARGLLAAMHAGETVGLLMDQNMMPPAGVFVSFFGVPACTAAGLARLALRTDASVVPAFTIWDATLRKYRITFAPRLALAHSGDDERDVLDATQLFTSVIEDYVRKHPDQWLWVHRRWKTRPEGEPSLY